MVAPVGVTAKSGIAVNLATRHGDRLEKSFRCDATLYMHPDVSIGPNIGRCGGVIAHARPALVSVRLRIDSSIRHNRCAGLGSPWRWLECGRKSRRGVDLGENVGDRPQ